MVNFALQVNDGMLNLALLKELKSSTMLLPICLSVETLTLALPGIEFQRLV